MIPRLNLDDRIQVVTIAIIFAIVLGIFTSVFFVIINKEAFSAIYIVPKTIVHNTDDNSVIFAYGVKSSESGKIEYTLETYQDNKLLKTRQFSLNPGDILDEQDKISLAQDTEYPTKISLRLITNKATEEVHFWIR